MGTTHNNYDDDIVKILLKAIQSYMIEKPYQCCVESAYKSC